MPTYELSSGPVAVAASTIKTIVDIATPAGLTATVPKWWVGSDAVSAGTATSGIRVQVGIFSAAVTTHTAGTGLFYDWGANGINAQSTTGIATTVEGAGTALYIEEHPLGLTQSELLVWEVVPRIINVSSFWRIRVITPAGIGATNIYAGVMWTE